MARIRTIKPEFWTDAKTGTLTETSKCLLLGLLNHSDDYGVLEFSPVEWRAKILPYHSDTTTGTVKNCLVEELLPRGLVSIFSYAPNDDDPRQYLFITNFAKHQVINKPSKPVIPGWKLGDNPSTYSSRMGVNYAEFSDSVNDNYTTTPTPLREGYFPERKGKEGERKGEEGVVVEQAQPSPSKSKQADDQIEPIGTNWIDLTPTDPTETDGWPKSVDLQIAARFWNDKAAGELGLPEVRALTRERSKHLSARLREIGSLGEWFAAVNAIRAQPFLTGRNDRQWRANFDWFIKPSNFSKVIEQTYERSNANGHA